MYIYVYYSKRHVRSDSVRNTVPFPRALTYSRTHVSSTDSRHARMILALSPHLQVHALTHTSVRVHTHTNTPPPRAWLRAEQTRSYLPTGASHLFCYALLNKSCHSFSCDRL